VSQIIKLCHEEFFWKQPLNAKRDLTRDELFKLRIGDSFEVN